MLWIFSKGWEAIGIILLAALAFYLSGMGFEQLALAHPDRKEKLEVGMLILTIACGLLAIVGAGLLYLLPSSAALRYRHRHVQAIIVLNALLGWTFLGWVLALVWAMTAAGLKDLSPENEPSSVPQNMKLVPEQDPDDDLIGRRFLGWLGAKLGALFSRKDRSNPLS